MPAALPLLVDLAVKVAVVGLSLYPLRDPGSSHCAGKAMGIRALLYPGFTLLSPAVWFLSGRPGRYPFLQRPRRRRDRAGPRSGRVSPLRLRL